MESRRVRLGDVIDDYCPKCRLIMNHGVVSLVVDEVKKVRCNTCLSEHQFRRGQLPKSRSKAQAKLFEEVLKGISGPQDPPASEPKPPEPPPQSAHRRLYTIHRAIGGKSSGKGPKKA
ncbi:MAG TPA: hypothetical protein VGV60_03855 [Candidatus Polarisedimenticolia bacterium]|jgi:hypothetical protein|nr:hypothetical protein [Candidatus Polarisedimenticolia bacterium]